MAPDPQSEELYRKETAVSITDYDGREILFETCPQRVIALSGSLGEVWLDAGGTLVGATEDAVSERGLVLEETVEIVGTIKQPDLERVLALEPDFIILTADVESHRQLAMTLEELQIPYGLFHEELFADYLGLLEQFCAVTSREDLLQENGFQVQAEIGQTLADCSRHNGKTVLLLRAYSSGFKAKGRDHLAGAMLADFGLENVLDRYDTLLEEISLEEILTVDPDYIFVTVMGSDTEAAMAQLDQQLCSDPAWNSLTAIEQGNYHVLPKDLFHYKPNARWAEAYAHLAELLDRGSG